MRKALVFAGLVAVVLAARSIFFRHGEPAGGRALRLATTTSVMDSGLLVAFAPAFEKQTGYHLDVKATGSGKAIELLRSGAVDVAITHAPAEEREALAAGGIGRRTLFMHNDFVVIGPKSQASVVAGATSATDAFQRIAKSGRKFISRGDGSGTNQAELQFWQSSAIAPDSSFIESAHAGMGATLDRASKQEAFTLADRGTFLARRRNLDLVIVFQGDPALQNHYSVLEPRPGQSANVDGARALSSFVRSDAGRALIGSFGIDRFGEALFTPEQ